MQTMLTKSKTERVSQTHIIHQGAAGINYDCVESRVCPFQEVDDRLDGLLDDEPETPRGTYGPLVAVNIRTPR